MKYAWIKSHSDSYRIKILCDTLGVSRSGYYGWLGAPACKTKLRIAFIGDESRRVFEENHGVVGYRKVHEDLKENKIDCCKETVRKTLTKQGLHATVAPKFVLCTTDSDHGLPVADNLLDRDFTASRPNEKWCGDITYIRTREGWLYLAVVIDLFSRKVVGWSMSNQIKSDLVLKAFDRGDSTSASDRQSGFSQRS